MSIIPLKEKTNIFFVIENKDYNKLSHWFNELYNPFFLLNAIEEFMIYGTDEWCIKPSVWKAIPPNRQEIILTEICSNKSFSFTGTNLSIFDEIRSTLISSAQEMILKNNVEINKNLNKWIEQERKKLYYNPSISLKEKEEKFRNEYNNYFGK